MEVMEFYYQISVGTLLYNVYFIECAIVFNSSLYNVYFIEVNIFTTKMISYFVRCYGTLIF